MKKKLMIFGIPAVILIIVVILVSGRSSNPSELVNGFEDAIENGDASALMGAVTVNEGVTWSEKQANSIIQHLKENESDFEDQMLLLNAQAAYYETNGQTNNEISQMYPGESISDVGPFYITQEDGFFGEKPVLKARGYTLKVNAPKGTAVTFQNNSMTMEGKEQKLGLFGPGVYTVEGKKDFDYTTVQDTAEVTMFDPEDFEETASLNLEGETVQVESDIPNTYLMLNGERQDVNLSDQNSFGPVEDGLEIQGVKEFPWGTLKSDPQEISSSEENQEEETSVFNSNDEGYDLTPKVLTEDMQEQVKTIINGYAKQSIQAKSEQNAGVLENVSDNIRKEFTQTIQGYDGERYFEGEALGTRIDFSQVTYEQGEGGSHNLTIPVEFHENSREVYEYVDTELEEVFSEQTVTLTYNEENQNWTIMQVDNDPNSFQDDYMTSEEVVQTQF
ncbi:TcaA 3rd/4th domain-containing protein [Lentibacillus jeotgali]|uniref:TcaA 3rd/4th domain-containing protein n=1 Tax=Lentibacillus jeotgali TaxID=558169 RepID=UPI000262887E|nr:hypothetical protein [Lentibacillus jeotgali]